MVLAIPTYNIKIGKQSLEFPRYTIVILFVALALFVGYTHRIVVSVTKLAVSREYNWSQIQESQYIASYYYGYIMPQLIIGIACQLWGGKWVLAIGIGMSSVFTLVAPFAASNFSTLIAVRVLTGLFQGVAIPATTALYGRWIPKEIYSIATGIQHSGTFLGTAFTNGIYSLIMNAKKPGSEETWGWKGFKSGPEEYHDYVDEETVPILDSQLLDQEGSQDVLLYIVLLVSSFVADRFITSKTFSRTMVRKIFVTIGFGVPAICLVGLAFTKSQIGGSILLLFAIAFSGVAVPGIFPMALDMSKEYAGIIVSLSNTLATIPGIVAPLFTGLVLTTGNCHSDETDGENDSCRFAWRVVLLISATVYVIGIIAMNAFGSADEIDFDSLVEQPKDE
ncbi:hypothetical protein HK096_010339 [Nowakowskiella sp. JEL0078]|nr:hypothetical protein HK096_010339 [Nowakowskiella sp. JEL0078]